MSLLLLFALLVPLFAIAEASLTKAEMKIVNQLKHFPNGKDGLNLHNIKPLHVQPIASVDQDDNVGEITVQDMYVDGLSTFTVDTKHTNDDELVLNIKEMLVKLESEIYREFRNEYGTFVLKLHKVTLRFDFEKSDGSFQLTKLDIKFQNFDLKYQPDDITKREKLTNLIKNVFGLETLTQESKDRVIEQIRMFVSSELTEAVFAAFKENINRLYLASASNKAKQQASS